MYNFKEKESKNGLIPTIVPAYAGVNLQILNKSTLMTNRPRVCGGEPMARKELGKNEHIVPAYARVNLSSIILNDSCCNRPRVCGGESIAFSNRMVKSALSPRMRG